MQKKTKRLIVKIVFTLVMLGLFLGSIFLPKISNPLGGKSEIPPAPLIATPIVDETGILTDEDIVKISQTISNSEDTTDGTGQIAVYMKEELPKFSSVEGEANRVAREWGVGSELKDGILLYITTDGHIRIETADRAAEKVPDARAMKIINETIQKHLKEDKNFAEAINYATGELRYALGGETVVKVSAQENKSNPVVHFLETASGGRKIVAFTTGIILLQILLSGGSRRGGFRDNDDSSFFGLSSGSSSGSSSSGGSIGGGSGFSGGGASGGF